MNHHSRYGKLQLVYLDAGSRCLDSGAQSRKWQLFITRRVGASNAARDVTDYTIVADARI